MSTITTNAYGFIMPTHTKKSTSRPDCYTKAAWENATFNAYLDFVKVIERKATPEDYLSKHVALFNTCGMPADVDHLLSLTIAIAKDTTVKGEAVRKVLSCTTFRQFFNGAWLERENRTVVYTAPKAPKPEQPKAPKKVKDPTKAQLQAQNAELKAQIEKLCVALGLASPAVAA